VGLLVLGNTTVFASEMDFGIGEDQFFLELPTIVSVTRLPQTKDKLPASVTVIDRQMIDDSGAVSITDLFKMVPGFQIGHYHDYDGSKTAVTYNGLGDQYSRRMQVLVDGRSIYTQMTGGPEWPDVPLSLDEIDRIEVVRGPNGVTYGMNAFQATINIITRHPDSYNGDSVLLQLGERGSQRAKVRYVNNQGQFKYTFKLEHQASTGYRDLLPNVTGLSEVNDDSTTSSFTFRGDYQADINDQITFNFGYGKGPREVGEENKPAPDTPEPQDILRDKQMKTIYQHLNWRHDFDSESELNLQLYKNVHEVVDNYTVMYSDMLLMLEPTSTDTERLAYMALLGLDSTLEFPLDFGFYSDRENMELSYKTQLSEQSRIVVGGELRKDKTNESDFTNVSGEYVRDSKRVFFNYEVEPIKDTTINIGDMFEDNDSYGGNHSPRLAVNYSLNNNNYIRVSASQAWRAPVFLEEKLEYLITLPGISVDPSITSDVFFLYVNNPNLKPERIRSTELAYGYHNSGNRFSFDFRLFQDNYRDLISTPRDLSSKVTSLFNNTNNTIQGSEVYLKLGFKDNSNLYFGHSNVETKGYLLDKTSPDVYLPLSDFVPARTTTILFTKKFSERLTVGLNFYMVSTMEFFSGDQTGGYSANDISLNYLIGSLKKPDKFSVLVKNVNGSYYDFEDETGLEKQLYISYQATF
jgi:iron complex outermembrane receptor protein